MIKKSKLSVSVHDVEFAKDFQYFVSVHYEGQKVTLHPCRNKLMYPHWLEIPSSPKIYSFSIYLPTTL